MIKLILMITFVVDHGISLSSTANSLCVTIDCDLKFDKYINATCKSLLFS